MELEQLKQQWEILHAKLDEQQIINKRLMENAVIQKIDFINTYNWIGIILGIGIIPIVIFWGKTKQIENGLLVFIICILIFFVILGVYKALQFKKTNSFRNNILDAEKIITKHEKTTFWYYIITLVVAVSFLVTFGLTYYELLIAYKRHWILLSIFAFVVIGSIGEMRWYLKKIKNLHQSISDLKEFEKEE